MQKLPSAPRAGRTGSGGRGRFGRRRQEPTHQVYGITTARTGQHQDVNKRARRYMVSMTIRLVCLVLAFVFFGTWEAWVFAGGAVILPYIAVLMANSGRERQASPPTAMMDPASSTTAAGSPAGGHPAQPRALGAVPARTTPAADPWADARVQPPGHQRPGGSGAAWQHSYTSPGGQRPRAARPAARRSTRA